MLHVQGKRTSWSWRSGDGAPHHQHPRNVALVSIQCGERENKQKMLPPTAKCCREHKCFISQQKLKCSQQRATRVSKLLDCDLWHVRDISSVRWVAGPFCCRASLCLICRRRPVAIWWQRCCKVYLSMYATTYSCAHITKLLKSRSNISSVISICTIFWNMGHYFFNWEHWIHWNK